MKEDTLKASKVKKNWWLVDAEACPLGRLAGETAVLLRGKHKPEFTPHIDTGDFVVVINAKKVQLTGAKWNNKKYFSHSGFFGSLKEKRARDLSGKELINKAVSGMLPKNKMRRKLMKKLKVYESTEHPHKAQKPLAYSLKYNKGGTVSLAGETSSLKESLKEKGVKS